MVYSITGGKNRVSKADRGGFNAVGQKPRTIPIPNRAYLEGTLNVFEIIKKYRDIRVSTGCSKKTVNFQMQQYPTYP